MKHPKFYITLIVVIAASMVAIASQVGAAPLADLCAQPNTSVWIANGQGTAYEGGWYNVAGYVVFAMDFPDVVMNYGDYWIVNSTSWGAQPSSWFHATVVDMDGVSYDVVGGPGATDYHFGWAGSPTAGYLPVPDAAYGKRLHYLQIQSGSYANVSYGTGTVFYGSGACATATPTGMPTSTPFTSYGGICLTATPIVSATIQATPTPYGTARPTATRNPLVSPTPTITATATATGTTSSHLQYLEWSSSANFAAGLQPWTAGLSYLCPTCDPLPLTTTWITDTGQDGTTGSARIGGWGLKYSAIALESGSYFKTVALNGTDYTEATGAYYPSSIILALPTDVTRPINIQGSVKAIQAPHTNVDLYINVWYLDPGLPDSVGVITESIPVWVGKPAWSQKISYVWGDFGIRITPDTAIPGYKAGMAQALAITWYAKAADYSGASVDYDIHDNGILVDDLKVTIGDGADALLPICNADGTPGSVGYPGHTGKGCVINITAVDLRATCKVPTTLDLGAWLSYLWCNTWHFFGYFDENRAQVDAIITRQSLNEPFGSLFETAAIADDFNAKVTTLQSENKTQAQTPIDWARMMLDGSALDSPTHFAVPDPISAQTYMQNCPGEAMFSNATTAGACMALYLMRQTMIVTVFQWGLNALFVGGILMMVRGDLEKLAA